MAQETSSGEHAGDVGEAHPGEECGPWCEEEMTEEEWLERREDETIAKAHAEALLEEFPVGSSVEFVPLPGYPRPELVGVIGEVVGYEDVWVFVKWPVLCGVCVGDCSGRSHRCPTQNLRLASVAS